jgi:hypothetical protein
VHVLQLGELLLDGLGPELTDLLHLHKRGRKHGFLLNSNLVVART